MSKVQPKNAGTSELAPCHRDFDSPLMVPWNPLHLARLTSREAEKDGYVLLESMAVGIYGLDLNGRVTFANSYACQVTGWTFEELCGRTQHSMVHHSYADGRHYPREECPIYSALQDGRVHHRVDEVFWRKDGTSFPVEYTSTPVFEAGKVTGATVVFSDTTVTVRQKNWSDARISVLMGIVECAPLTLTIKDLANAFESFYQGCSIHAGTVSEVKDKSDLAAGHLLTTITMAHRDGTVVIAVNGVSPTHSASFQERAAALTELRLLLALALRHSIRHPAA